MEEYDIRMLRFYGLEIDSQKFYQVHSGGCRCQVNEKAGKMPYEFFHIEVELV